MRVTKSTMIGWTKTGKGEYTHAEGHTVRRVGHLWFVAGPNQNDGYGYSALWVAMEAAAKTPAVFVR